MVTLLVLCTKFSYGHQTLAYYFLGKLCKWHHLCSFIFQRLIKLVLVLLSFSLLIQAVFILRASGWGVSIFLATNAKR